VTYAFKRAVRGYVCSAVSLLLCMFKTSLVYAGMLQSDNSILLQDSHRSDMVVM
jgi:hypothetical protein